MRVLHVAPTHLTISGGAAGVLAGVYASQGSFRAMAFTLAALGALDILDGEVARRTGRVTRFGAFLDSVVDRYAEAALFGGVLYYYGMSGRGLETVAVLAAWSGAFLTSYAKARAENLIPACQVGFLERGERLFLLALGGVTGRMEWGIYTVALLAHVTALQRICYVRGRIRAIQEEGKVGHSG